MRQFPGHLSVANIQEQNDGNGSWQAPLTPEKDLKCALQRSAALVLFEGSVPEATTSVTLEPISDSPLTVDGFSKGLMDDQDRYRNVLREHPSSWLFGTGGPKLSPL